MQLCCKACFVLTLLVNQIESIHYDSLSNLPFLTQRKAPYCGYSVDIAPAVRAALGNVTKNILTYLGDCLFISHGCLFDKAMDFYIPISTRNNYPGLPETHRHFHFSGVPLYFVIPIIQCAASKE